MLILRLAAVAAVALLGGCEYLSKQSPNVNGAENIARNPKAVMKTNLIQLIVPPDYFLTGDRLRLASPINSPPLPHSIPADEAKTLLATTCMQDTEITDDDVARACLDKATHAFDLTGSDTDKQNRRNQIQERLLAASQDSCRVFKQNLNSFQATTNLLTGLTATFLGAAGAVVGEAIAARALSGSAAAVTGARAEFNADLFFKQAVPSVAKAIDVAREEFYAKTITPNQAKSIQAYPLWASIKDAIEYNDRCSLVKGLNQIDASLKLDDEVGIDAFNKAALKINLGRKIVDRRITDSSVIKSDGTGNAALIPVDPGEVTIGRLAPELATMPQDALRAAASALSSARSSVQQALDALTRRLSIVKADGSADRVGKTYDTRPPQKDLDAIPTDETKITAVHLSVIAYANFFDYVAKLKQDLDACPVKLNQSYAVEALARYQVALQADPSLRRQAAMDLTNIDLKNRAAVDSLAAYQRQAAKDLADAIGHAQSAAPLDQKPIDPTNDSAKKALVGFIRSLQPAQAPAAPLCGL